MNWKQGFLRIYVVAWVLFAAFVGYTLKDGDGLGDYHRGVLANFLEAYPNVTLKQVQSGEARRILAAEDAKNRAQAESLGQQPSRGPTEFKGSSLDLAEFAAASEYVRTPWKEPLKTCGIWALIALGIPGAILLVATWILKGFKAKPPAHRAN